MRFFRSNTPPIQKPIDPVVSNMKKQTHQAAQDATRNAERLNSLFRHNVITLNIHSRQGAK